MAIDQVARSATTPQPARARNSSCSVSNWGVALRVLLSMPSSSGRGPRRTLPRDGEWANRAARTDAVGGRTYIGKPLTLHAVSRAPLTANRGWAGRGVQRRLGQGHVQCARGTLSARGRAVGLASGMLVAGSDRDSCPARSRVPRATVRAAGRRLEEPSRCRVSFVSQLSAWRTERPRS
jgi:hypothetical protein